MADASSTKQVPPEKSAQSNASETPRTNRTDGARTPITQLRAQIANEMDQEFVECSFDDFMATYMPFIPTDANVGSCIQAMLTESLMALHDDEPEFKAFNERTSKNMTEAVYFKPLEKIAAVIGRCIIENRQCNYPYKDLHARTIASGIDGSTNKCDGYFKAGDSEDLSTTSIAVPCELKVSSSASKKCDNNIKVVSANVQIMNADLRRMFTFGLTIEGDHMTLWYLSRSHSVVSKPENYVKNPKSLIKVFMSFMFASSDKMGYDPQVTLNKDGSYTYAIPPAAPIPPADRGSDKPHRFFRTIKPISEYRSNNITGRMARIWLVAEVTSVDAPILDISTQYVLKDVWLEEDAKTEQEIQTEIFRDIEMFLNNKELSPAEAALQPLQETHFNLLKNVQYRKYFLTIEAGSVGEPSTRVVVGGTRARNLFVDKDKLPSLAMSTSAKLFQSHQTGQTSRQGSGTPRPVATQKQDIDRHFQRRKRYRVVFQEVCETVGDLKTLGEVVDVIAQTLIPLQLMFCAGWVHRDISSGNILAYKVGKDGAWMVKLSDLEYAKRFPPRQGCAAHVDPKTGTPYFMPHEILAEEYLHNEPEVVNHEENQDVDELDTQMRAVFAGPPDPGPISIVPSVVHNFQHDLESLWWLLLWTLTSRVPYADSKAFGETIFQNTIQLSVARKQAFVYPIKNNLLTHLCPAVSSFAIPMEILRESLHLAAFTRKQEGNLNQPGSYVKIHTVFTKYLRSVMKLVDMPWAGLELDTHSAYLNAPNLNAESHSVAPPTDTQKTTPSAAPQRFSKRIAASTSNKRPRDATEDEGEGAADNVTPSARSTRKKAAGSSKRSRTGDP